MKGKLSRINLIAIMIVAVCVIAFAVILPIYLKHNAENSEIYEEQKIRILLRGELIGEYTFDELAEYSPAVEFTAVYKPNNMLPQDKTYTGIFLHDLITAMELDTTGVTSVKFTAKDGMQKSYSISEVQEEGNVYIANTVSGLPFNNGINIFAYTKEQEDGGPFVVIKAKDSVSQNRVKLLVEINLL
ncbi:MAG: hypothetical protein EOM87_04745 [Clostridia bacterium]|nr:hypothetical protein [Clostridia bacterium]